MCFLVNSSPLLTLLKREERSSNVFFFLEDFFFWLVYVTVLIASILKGGLVEAVSWDFLLLIFLLLCIMSFRLKSSEDFILDKTFVYWGYLRVSPNRLALSNFQPSTSSLDFEFSVKVLYALDIFTFSFSAGCF